MPPQTTYSSPQQEKTINWPLIILGVLGVIVLILAGVLMSLYRSEGKTNNNTSTTGNSGNNIAVGEPNPSGQTMPVGSGDFNCDTDTYNCDDFGNQAEAQRAFDQCSSQGFGDIHQLDNDGDGKVCEGLS